MIVIGSSMDLLNIEPRTHCALLSLKGLPAALIVAAQLGNTQ